MEKITYTNKETLNEIPSIPDKNKCKASDLNEIKSVVNANADSAEDIVIVPTETSTEDTKLEIESEDFGGVDGSGTYITNAYSESTALGYSANYVNKNITDVVDISSLITKTSNVGTIYILVAYKKGSRCYLNTIFDLNALGNVFTLDNSILPKYGEIETATNYDTISTISCFARINANVNSIEITLYGTKKDYCALHIEWEV